MAVVLLMNPSVLTWDDFEQVDEVKDPVTGERSSAFTSFDWEWPTKPLRKVGSEVTFPDITLMVTPDCKVRKDSVVFKDKTKAKELLSHEQFHYDVAHVCGRVLVHRLNQLQAKDAATLNAQADVLFNLHFGLRPKLINRHYDRSTRHGMDASHQRAWKEVMAATLADKNALMMRGHWL